MQAQTVATVRGNNNTQIIHTYNTSQTVHKDYLPWSIFNLLCCLPLGMVALFFSIQTRKDRTRQDSQAESGHSRSAFIWNAVSQVAGLCGHIAWIAYLIYAKVTENANSSSYTYYG